MPAPRVGYPQAITLLPGQLQVWGSHDTLLPFDNLLEQDTELTENARPTIAILL